MAESPEDVEADLEALKVELGDLAICRRAIEARFEELGPADARDSRPSIPSSPVAGAARAMLRRVAVWQIGPLLPLFLFFSDGAPPWEYLRVISFTSAAAAAVYGFDRWATKNPERALELRQQMDLWLPKRMRRRGPKMRVPTPEAREERKRHHRERAFWKDDRQRRRKGRGGR